jgi:fructose-1,6-bisphosphatase/inositol monophosphatase family enzyme/predicted metal-dependent phosphoesterase TrpH
MIGDLHIHTCHSDSSNTVRDVLLEARERGLRFVSIADQDTIAGLEEAFDLGAILDITVVAGVEISAFDVRRGAKVHVLGYGFALPATAITELCRPVLEQRQSRTLDQIECLRREGYDITVDEVRAVARGSAEGLNDTADGRAADGSRALTWPHDPVLYKQHIMAVLTSKGYTDRIYSDLYRDLFTGDGPCAGDIKYADVFDAVRAIVSDGGVAVLAHPGQQDSYHLVEPLVEAGLGGIELYHEDNGRQDHRRIRELAVLHDLILTGGSDDRGSLGSSHLLGEIVAPKGVMKRLIRYDDPDIEWAVDMVRTAGEMARSAALADIEADLKGGDIRDLVTRHDREIDRFLSNSIHARFPGHGFVTEEHDHAEVAPGDPVWIIDPIDGTTNFVSSRTYFAVSVAHYVGDRPVFGIVYGVMAEDMYIGIAGHGAYLNGRRLHGWERAKPVGECVVEMSNVATHRFRDWYDADPSILASSVRGQRAFGSAAIGICRIARGTLDGYVSSSLAPWDYAAAVIVLDEAGGSATIPAPEGESWFYGDRGFFVASGHPDTMRALLDLFIGATKNPRLLKVTGR